MGSEGTGRYFEEADGVVPTCAISAPKVEPPELTKSSMALPRPATPASARDAISEGPGSAWHLAVLVIGAV